MAEEDDGLGTKKVTEAVIERIKQETNVERVVSEELNQQAPPDNQQTPPDIAGKGQTRPRGVSENRIREIIAEEIAKAVPAIPVIPEFSDLLKWSEGHLDDVDCASFVAHAAPVAELRKYFPESKRLYGKGGGQSKGGGGWVGPAKATLTVLRKMQKERVA